MSDLYYIRRVPSGFCGNSPFWWAKDGRGYTSYILGAERFTEEKARNLVKENPEKWEMYRCDFVDERLHLIFDFQDKQKLGTEAPFGWATGMYAHNPYTPPITPEQARDTLDRLGYFEYMCEDCKELTPIITKALKHFAGER